MKRFSRVIRARVGYTAGVAVASSGVGVVFGAGWALIAAGVTCAASFLVLYDVDEQKAGDQ